jgi:regulatory protein
VNPARPVFKRSASELKGKALQWLSQREHSRQELARKLTRWLSSQRSPEWGLENDADGQPTGEVTNSRRVVEDASVIGLEIDGLLDELTQAGLLSERRFVESRVRVRQSRFGNRRIEHELKLHGLEPTPEQKAELRDNEVDRALAALLCRSFSRHLSRPLQRDQVLKCQRFLASRGFSSEAIHQAIRRLGQPGEP